MRVAFAGTPEFSAAALAALHQAGFTIPLVLSQPDRPAGRGMKLTPSPVKVLALQLGAPVAQPRSLRLDGKFPDEAQAARQALLQAAPDVLVVAAYGLILPAWVLKLPRMGCVNIHASLLPRWRGAAPIHRAIEAGDALTGVTLMQMDEGLDTGDMLVAEPVAIQAADTTATLHDRLAALGARMVVAALQQVEAGGRLTATPQPEQGITYAHKIEKRESAIDWRLPAVQIERRVRAFDPFPGASFEQGGEVVKVWQAAVRQDLAGPPGRVLSASGEPLVVACGEGALALQVLQRPGGKRLPASAFVQARGHLAGETLAVPD